MVGKSFLENQKGDEQKEDRWRYLRVHTRSNEEEMENPVCPDTTLLYARHLPLSIFPNSK